MHSKAALHQREAAVCMPESLPMGHVCECIRVCTYGSPRPMWVSSSITFCHYFLRVVSQMNLKIVTGWPANLRNPPPLSLLLQHWSPWGYRCTALYMTLKKLFSSVPCILIFNIFRISYYDNWTYIIFPLLQCVPNFFSNSWPLLL